MYKISTENKLEQKTYGKLPDKRRDFLLSDYSEIFYYIKILYKILEEWLHVWDFSKLNFDLER